MKNIEQYKNRFYQLLESNLGNVRPLITENELGEDKVDLTGTYLDPNTRNKPDYKERKKRVDSEIYSKTGKIFKDNPTTATKDNFGRGVNFDKIDDYNYKVTFSKEFLEKYFSESISKQSKNYGVYGMEHDPDSQVPIEVGDKRIDELLNKDIQIKSEGAPTNRIHFAGGIPPQLDGIGLGYVIYEEFIKYLGYASSKSDASSFAQNVWSKIASDPDFYTVVIKNAKIYFETILAIHKNMEFQNPVDIAYYFVKHYSDKIDDETVIKIGENFLSDYPNIKMITSKTEVSTKTVKQLTASLNRIGGILVSNKIPSKDFNDYFKKGIIEKIKEINNLIYKDGQPNETYDAISDDVNNLEKLLLNNFYTDINLGDKGRKKSNGATLVDDPNVDPERSVLDSLTAKPIWSDNSPYFEYFEESIAWLAEFVKFYKNKKPITFY